MRLVDEQRIEEDGSEFTYTLDIDMKQMWDLVKQTRTVRAAEAIASGAALAFLWRGDRVSKLALLGTALTTAGVVFDNQPAGRSLATEVAGLTLTALGNKVADTLPAVGGIISTLGVATTAAGYLEYLSINGYLSNDPVFSDAQRGNWG